MTPLGISRKDTSTVLVKIYRLKGGSLSISLRANGRSWKPPTPKRVIRNRLSRRQKIQFVLWLLKQNLRDALPRKMRFLIKKQLVIKFLVSPVRTVRGNSSVGRGKS